VKAPETIANMIDLRVEIDKLDREIVEMMAKRVTLIDRAAELKPGEGLPARIETRVEAVVANVRQCAEASGCDADLIEQIWRKMIDWSIEREEVVLGKGEGA
jgi:isochorismate pyruvate lyase